MLCIVEQIIEEQLSNGISERFAAEKDNEKENVRYLPHHAVIWRDRETTKLRNVYDGSAKHAECTHSLNDWLETGPNYTPPLFDTLLRILRFLWFKDPDDLNTEIVHLKFTRLVFGLRPSPGISASTIQHHLDSQVTEEFKPHFTELLKKSFYVDYLVTGKGSEARVLELCWKSKSLMQRGGFNLRKWKTNSKSARADQWNERPRESNNWTWKDEDHYWKDELYAKTTNGPPIIIAAANTSENAIV